MKNLFFSDFLQIMILAVFLYSCSSKNDRPVNPPERNTGQPFTVNNSDTTWIKVDRMPEYRGGEKALVDYVSRSIVYPEEAKKAGTEGRVIARFRVGVDGRISMATVLKGVDPLLDAETIRVINSITFDEPGYIKNRPVPVWYLLPVVYSLKR